MVRQTDRQIHRQAGETDRQTGRQKDWQTHRQVRLTVWQVVLLQPDRKWRSKDVIMDSDLSGQVGGVAPPPAVGVVCVCVCVTVWVCQRQQASACSVS